MNHCIHFKLKSVNCLIIFISDKYMAKDYLFKSFMQVALI